MTKSFLDKENTWTDLIELISDEFRSSLIKKCYESDPVRAKVAEDEYNSRSVQLAPQKNESLICINNDLPHSKEIVQQSEVIVIHEDRYTTAMVSKIDTISHIDPLNAETNPLANMEQIKFETMEQFHDTTVAGDNRPNVAHNITMHSENDSYAAPKTVFHQKNLVLLKIV